MAKTSTVLITVCPYCGGLFETKTKDQQYCDRTCSARATGPERGDTQRGSGNGKTRCPSLGGKPIYRTLVERALEITALPSYLVVHHCDGDPRNNDLSNLVLMTRSEHCKIHQRQLVEGRRKAAVGRAAASHLVARHCETNGITRRRIINTASFVYQRRGGSRRKGIAREGQQAQMGM